ncbi:Uroporphyrinogen-III C-methyltransferase [uncultured Desulfobacterium sp.]|uniref:uroporphyrinogen-III C-methyltransferase n=1 Tax=uncultured Desulfobacterium sp. TaxID=201089 RepID=A0A445N2A1_9BACT|nr:Uroporphyrinogen-III C-methyltransferase [uncultured Desulfobacterium sp.]
MTKSKKGIVYLVGAGPGDPGLLTIKGKECISEADVVIYDYLANKTFLDYARKDAEIIYVGKSGGCHTMSQDEINEMIIKKGQEGHTVVRLKGGDPYIFGRGGEEAQECFKAGLAFEVIPGISSAIAVPAYAGIPLTHRDYTATVTFITGHESPEKEESNIAWDKVATSAGTLVFLMGVGNLPNITERLMQHGRSGDTPVAVIRRGTVSEQKTLTGNLDNIARMVKDCGMKPPAIIVVGEVVKLRDELNWFENRPLFGKRIVVTRARQQASGFVSDLTRLGAQCIEFPTIEIAPPQSWGALDKAIDHLEDFQWLLFTSVNGVKYFLERLKFHHKDIRDLKGLKIGAIGPKTAEAWTTLGIIPDLLPDEYRAEAVIECFKKIGPIEGLKILLPRASSARDVLPDELTKMGVEISVVPAYQTILADQNTQKAREMLKDSKVDMVTFTSSSTVLNFIDMFSEDSAELIKWMNHVAVACIGPITAETARKKGLSVDLCPAVYTIEALTDSIVDYYSNPAALGCKMD